MIENDMKLDIFMENEYATKDLYQAAFLYIQKVPLLKLEKYGRGRRGQSPVYFVFDNKKECERLEEVFWSGAGDDAMINVKEYYTAVRDLRGRAFSVSRQIKQAEIAGRIVENESY